MGTFVKYWIRGETHVDLILANIVGVIGIYIIYSNFFSHLEKKYCQYKMSGIAYVCKCLFEKSMVKSASDFENECFINIINVDRVLS